MSSFCQSVCCITSSVGYSKVLSDTRHSSQKVHVAHVNIDGMVELPRYKAMMPDKPDGFFLKPAAIADTYWALHEQDSSAWTHEMDLRPAIEKW